MNKDTGNPYSTTTTTTTTTPSSSLIFNLQRSIQAAPVNNNAAGAAPAATSGSSTGQTSAFPTSPFPRDSATNSPAPTPRRRAPVEEDCKEPESRVTVGHTSAARSSAFPTSPFPRESATNSPAPALSRRVPSEEDYKNREPQSAGGNSSATSSGWSGIDLNYVAPTITLKPLSKGKVPSTSVTENKRPASPAEEEQKEPSLGLRPPSASTTAPSQEAHKGYPDMPIDSPETREKLILARSAELRARTSGGDRASAANAAPMTAADRAAEAAANKQLQDEAKEQGAASPV